ncbi:phage portal protein [Caulobacter zeae]|uniref:Phage portal protein n=1 Tax=Caulobacter zeae TaxID=2055137 RepID=A0A2N5DQ08_9CAUL|nr:phage portal protein [Caulobacter zeae]PLR28141.1 phage portal protein [Caulobacter zeae]
MAIPRPLVLSEGETVSLRSRPSSGSAAGLLALSLSDPLIAEFFRGGYASASGATVNVETALRNPAMFRALSLISYAIGMLPFQVIDETTKEKATGHALYRLLHREPNGWQTAFDFRSLMQLRALVYGDAYALIVRSYQVRSRRSEPVRLIPLNPDWVKPVQADDWSVTYEYSPPKGGRRVFAASEIFHLRGLSLDGFRGLSLVRQAREAIGLAISAELASARLFKNGAFVSGVLEHPGSLSETAYGRLKESLSEKEGADNAWQSMILEEGMKWGAVGSTARDAELAAFRKMQVEEIARVTGVPRPLLMVDETSWGSGVTALGQFFVQYALNPWFEAWQQAAERSMLADAEKDRFSIKFNPNALLRGSVKDQGEFFAKALGAGGAPGWMTQNEVRDLNDLPARDGGDKLNPGSQAKPASQPQEDADEPPAAANSR